MFLLKMITYIIRQWQLLSQVNTKDFMELIKCSEFVSSGSNDGQVSFQGHDQSVSLIHHSGRSISGLGRSDGSPIDRLSVISELFLL